MRAIISNDPEEIINDFKWMLWEIGLNDSDTPYWWY